MAILIFNSKGLSHSKTKIAQQLFYVVIIICILPYILGLFCLDFGTEIDLLNLSVTPGLEGEKLNDFMHHSLAGSFVHTILEWSAVCVACFTVFLSFINYRITGEVTTPIIGVALLCAGAMDAFHTLAADRLIHSATDSTDLIPFTWAICRLFNALILILGTSLVLFANAKNIKPDRHKNFSFIFGLSLVLILIADAVIYLCATTENLPQTMFPDSIISRPFDIIPLIFYTLAGFWVFPKFHRKYPSLFSAALIISTIPNMAVQLYMALGSHALFDSSFNVAHFLKIIAYAIPLIGLVLDYIYTYLQVEQVVEERTISLQNTNHLLRNEINERQETEKVLRNVEANLTEKTVELEDTINNLKQTQVKLIQTEKMSALGQMVAGIAHEINNPVSFIHGNLHHANEYIETFIDHLQLYQQYYPNPVPEIEEHAEENDLDFMIEDLHEIFKSMNLGTQRIREIVLSLRNFSRLDESTMKTADLHEGLNNTLLILQHRFQAVGQKPEINLIKEYGNLPLVECYPGELNQVFMNIIINALDAVEAAILSSKTSEYIPQILIRTKSDRDGSQVTIEIEDNGLGFKKEICSKIFEPFFTTKPIGKGTGLGLSISYTVITRRHGGTLDSVSTPGKGSKFTIVLPVKQV